MKLFNSLVLSSILALAVACGGDDDGGNGAGADASTDSDAAAGATFDLTVELNGFGMAHRGQTVFFALWDNANTIGAVANQMVTVGGGGMNGNMAVFADGIEEGKTYAVYVYADVDGNTTCDGPALDMDHAWKIDIASVTAAATETLAHDTTFTGDCTKH